MASDTILSSYRVRLPFGPAPEPVALPGPANLPHLNVEPGPKRRRLWELSPTLHCSIIGTCLTAGELREILRRIAQREGFVVATGSDHDLHGLGVRLAERRDGAGKLLHKALDRRHAATIGRFAQAGDESALERQWRDALAAGAIPGAYWSVLTHPFTSERLVVRAFGEVHMLSHLVGASNRADIRRLRALEEENAHLRTELSGQRRNWRHALAQRDARLQELERQLHRLSASRALPEPASAPRPGALPIGTTSEGLAALEARLAKEVERRALAEERCRKACAQLASEREQRSAAGIENASLRAEADALEDQLHTLLGEARGPGPSPTLHLAGSRVLVVGARPAQIAHWRALVERCAGEFLHHDGGIEDSITGLGGFVKRSDIILFPTDCVSHEAVWWVKRLAAQLGKAYRPMRNASLAAFTRALREMAAGRTTNRESAGTPRPSGA